MKNSFLRTLYPFAIIYFTLIALFIAFLVFSVALPPTDKFQRNMKRSANYLLKEGEYPRVGQILLDNYSDSVLMNVAYNFNSRKPFLSAMNAEYYFISEVGEKGTEGFSKLVNGEKNSLQRTSYGRYWFGQSALIRLFMYIWNVKRIYSFFSSVFLVLAMIAFVLTWNQVGKYPAFVLALVLSFCNYYCFSLSFQYCPPACLDRFARTYTDASAAAIFLASPSFFCARNVGGLLRSVDSSNPVIRNSGCYLIRLRFLPEGKSSGKTWNLVWLSVRLGSRIRRVLGN